MAATWPLFITMNIGVASGQWPVVGNRDRPLTTDHRPPISRGFTDFTTAGGVEQDFDRRHEAVGTAGVDELASAAGHRLALQVIAHQILDGLADALRGHVFVPAE